MRSTAKTAFKIEHALAKAVSLHKAGQLQPAEEIYHQILHLRPDQADAWHLLGLIYTAKGEVGKAKQTIQRAIQCNQHIALFYVSYGDILQREKNFNEAISCYRQALKLDPDLIQALCNLGNTLRETGKFQEAIACYKRVIEMNPNLPESFNNLGLAYFEQGQYDACKACFKKAIGLNPHYFEAYNNLGNVYRDMAAYEKALTHYQQALALAPDNTSINYNVGLLYQKQKMVDKALGFYQKAIAHQPPMADAHNNLGKYYQDQHQPDKALYHYEKAIELDPAHFDARFNRSLSLLLKGDFEKGWPAYEWRFKLKNWRRIYPHRINGQRWDGKRFAGKSLLIHAEQGFGDTIWFVRYLPLVKSMGGRVILEVRAELADLLQGVAGIDQLLTLSFETPPTVSYDLYAPLMSLPCLLKTSLNTIPATVPYIKASRFKQNYWANQIRNDGLKIGLVWAAKATNDHERSCPLENFRPLFDLSYMRVFGLQKGEDAAQADSFPDQIINLGPDFITFEDTAGAIAALDLVISVDTSVAHLAGAMGKPVWLLLPYGADWKWLLERSDSPWYPSMQLFRQNTKGDWSAVFETIRTCLQQWKTLKNR